MWIPLMLPLYLFILKFDAIQLPASISFVRCREIQTNDIPPIQTGVATSAKKERRFRNFTRKRKNAVRDNKRNSSQYKQDEANSWTDIMRDSEEKYRSVQLAESRLFNFMPSEIQNWILDVGSDISASEKQAENENIIGYMDVPDVSNNMRSNEINDISHTENDRDIPFKDNSTFETRTFKKDQSSNTSNVIRDSIRNNLLVAGSEYVGNFLGKLISEYAPNLFTGNFLGSSII